MPPALLALPAVAGVASAAAGAAATAGIISATTAAIISVAASVIGLAASLASSLLFSPSTPKGASLASLPTQARDRIQTIRSSTDSHVVIYGTARVGLRPLVLAESTGSDERFLHIIGPMAGHEVNDVTHLGLDDEMLEWDVDITTSTGVVKDADSDRFNQSGNSLAKNGPIVRAFKTLGSADQAAFSKAVSEVSIWTSNHRLRGLAALYVRFQYNKSVFQNGMPDVSAIVQGRKVWDPRDTSQEPDDTSTHVFSNNWALCVLDYLRNGDFGLGSRLDEIDLASFIAAANISDELVESDNESPSTPQARYTCDGVIDTADTPISIVEKLLTAGAGALSYAQGKYYLFAGAFVTPTMTLTESDLAGPVEIQARRARAQLFNAVRGTYVEPEENYQPTDFVPRENATFQAQDGGFQIWRDVELPFTQDKVRAQRIAELVLRKSRQAITVKFPCKLSALDLAIFDTVSVTLDGGGANFGWTGKTFRVLGWEISEGLEQGIVLTLQEDDSSSYDWDGGDVLTLDPAPNTTLPNPFNIPAPAGVTLASGSDQLFVAGDGTVRPRVKVTWDEIDNIFVREGGEVEIQYRDAALGGSPLDWEDGNTQTKIVGGHLTVAFLTDVEDGATYDIRLRSRTNIGAVSDDDVDEWANTFNHLVIGKTEPPATPDILQVDRLADGTRRYTFSLNSEPLDLKGFLIRYFLGSTSDWDAMTPLHTGVLTDSPYESNELAAGTYTFACKAIDTTGNQSTTPIFAQAAIGNPRLRNVLVSRLEHDLGFPGTITNGFVDANGVLFGIAAAGTWNQLNSAWDSYTQPWFKLFSPDEPLQYETPEIDLGSEVSFTPLVTIEGAGNFTVEMRTGGDGSPQIETAYTSLAPVVGVRHIQFRITTVSSVSPQEFSSIASLTILLDGEVVIDDFENLDTSGADTDFFERIVAGHFRLGTRKELASISQATITAIQNVGPGYSWELISKDVRTGLASPQEILAAEFKVYDGTGTLADTIIDATLKGPKSS